MTLKLPSRQSRFGRRMLWILFLCVVTPGILLGYLSLRRVDAKLRDDALRRMRHQTHEVALSIHNGLGFLEEKGLFLAALIDSSAGPAGLEWLSKNRLVLGVSSFRRGVGPETLYGKPCPPPPTDSGSLAHLAAGKGLLYLDRGAGGTFRGFIACAMRGTPPDREMLLVEVNLEYIWEEVRDAIPPLSEAVILSPDGEILFATGAAPPGLLERIGQIRGKTHLGEFEWEKPDPLLVFHAMVFLKPSLHSEPWTVAVFQPRSASFGAVGRFTRILFLVSLLVVFSAALFAIVQVRRNVAPLELLEEGTRRISGGDFESRIEIGSGDEFEELAQSFNGMADRLGREFRVQEALGKTVQAILGETDRERIVRALLDNVASVVPCDCAALSLLETDGTENVADTRIRGESSAGREESACLTMHLRQDEIDRLKSAKTSVAAEPDREFREYLSHWPLPRPETFLLSPLVSHGELTGVLLLGHRKACVPGGNVLVRLRQIADQTAIALSRARLVDELNENDLGTLQAFSRAVDTNSPWTAGHSQRVTALAMEIGRELGLPAREIDVLHRGGLLHDIGKLGIPPAILDKPGKLTEEEFAVIRRHPSSGAEILRPIPSLGKIIPIVEQHHERFDGSGYPVGLAGEAISLNARIVAVADVADALSTDRPYRPGWPQEKVLSYLLENSGRQFDPSAAAAFLRVAERADNGSPAVFQV
ncbi:MAG: HD domain-containing phosphohydrolase [Thermodesulfobacteriota bacterium]